jgi:hypothetical protein
MAFKLRNCILTGALLALPMLSVFRMEAQVRIRANPGQEARVSISDGQTQQFIILDGKHNGGEFVLMISEPDHLIHLLHRPEVQRELNLTLKQKRALGLDKKQTSLNRQTGSYGQATPSGAPYFEGQAVSVYVATAAPPPPSGTNPPQTTEAPKFLNAVHTSALDEEAKKVLRPEQLERLMQLSHQWRGMVSLQRPSVAEKLKLSIETRQKIGELVREYRRLQGEIRSQAASADLSRPLSPARRKLENLRKDFEARALAMLSEEEKKAWTEEQGEIFTFKIVPSEDWRRLFY